jgi:hypothetical protein
LRREILGELVGEPETMVIDSTLLSVLHPRQVNQSAAGFEGAAWVRWGSFAVYGVKLHLICATNRIPLSYELTAANVADALLVRELVGAAGLGEGELARRLLGDLAYRGGGLATELWPSVASCLRPKGRIGARLSASRWRCALRLSKGTSGWTGRWPRRWWAWLPGSRRRLRPILTAATSTGCSVALKDASGTCGHENLATLI